MNYYSVGGRFVCKLDGRKKAYPGQIIASLCYDILHQFHELTNLYLLSVGAQTKLQCSLVSGCWDDTLPEGSKCYMAPDIFQEAFGQTEVYPSLYSNDAEELQCSSNVCNSLLFY